MPVYHYYDSLKATADNVSISYREAYIDESNVQWSEFVVKIGDREVIYNWDDQEFIVEQDINTLTEKELEIIEDVITTVINNHNNIISYTTISKIAEKIRNRIKKAFVDYEDVDFVAFNQDNTAKVTIHLTPKAFPIDSEPAIAHPFPGLSVDTTAENATMIIDVVPSEYDVSKFDKVKHSMSDFVSLTVDLVKNQVTNIEASGKYKNIPDSKYKGLVIEILKQLQEDWKNEENTVGEAVVQKHLTIFANKINNAINSLVNTKKQNIHK